MPLLLTLSGVRISLSRNVQTSPKAVICSVLTQGSQECAKAAGDTLAPSSWDPPTMGGERHLIISAARPGQWEGFGRRAWSPAPAPPPPPCNAWLTQLDFGNSFFVKGSHSAGNSALINLYVCNSNHNMSEKINLTNLTWVLIQIIHQTWAVRLYGVHDLRTVHFAPGEWTQCWDRTTEWKEISGIVTMAVWHETTASLCLGELPAEAGRTLSSQARGIRLKIEILLSVVDTFFLLPETLKTIYHFVF